MKKTYLNELVNSGIIEQQVSNINNKQYIYHPIIDLDSYLEDESISLSSKSVHFDNNLHHSRLLLPKNCINIPDNWLILEILGLLQYRNGNGNNGKIQLEDIKLVDKDGNGITIKEFCSEYELYNNLTRYAYKPKICNFHSKIFGSIQLLDHDDRTDVNTISNRGNFDIKDVNYRESELKSTEYLYRCYNNNCNFHTNDKEEYEIHGRTKHKGKPCHPGKADLELYGWRAQGKDWRNQ